MALAGEVSVLRERLDTVERLAAAKGLFTQHDIEAYRPDEAVMAERERWRTEYLERVLRVVHPGVGGSRQGRDHGIIPGRGSLGFVLTARDHRKNRESVLEPAREPESAGSSCPSSLVLTLAERLPTSSFLTRRAAGRSAPKPRPPPAIHRLACWPGLRKSAASANISPGDIAQIMHGTTVATNAVLEGKGAKVGLITTQGFKQILHLARSWDAGSARRLDDYGETGPARGHRNTPVRPSNASTPAGRWSLRWMKTRCAQTCKIWAPKESRR